VQQIVHKMLAVAVRSEWIVKNPADGIEMPQAEVQREVRILTDTEVDKLANAVPTPYRALVLMVADTGARPGEVIALRVKNLNGSVRIAETTVEVGGRRSPAARRPRAASETSPSPPGSARRSETTMTLGSQTGSTRSPSCSHPKGECR
jgi:integrase